MFKIGDVARISRYVPNRSEIDFVIKIIKNVPWAYLIRDLKSEEIVGTFYEKELVIYVKWKGYDNCFNSWIDRKT